MTEATKIKATEIARWLDSEPGPRSRAAIRRAIARRGIDVRAAISMLLADPSSGIVEVAPRIRGVYRVWTRAAAERAGLQVAERPGLELAELAPDTVSAPPPSAPAEPDPWYGYDDYGGGYS